ncbi:hypothetical protein BGZ46_002667 [Entomortierella lignicola]|nr:hypothetical protein BGZ46_002667 [Entomortierella lignicola]
MDPHRNYKEAINSWKRLLQDYDERNIASSLKRTEPESIAVTLKDDENSRVTSVIEKAIRLQKIKRQRTKNNACNSIDSQKGQTPKDRQDKGSEGHKDDNTAAFGQSETRRSGLDFSTDIIETMDTIEDDFEEKTKLKIAIASLRSKLETLQPEGSRPSDIAAISIEGSSIEKNNEGIASTGNTGSADVNEVLLSQDVASQRSILIWDEIQTIVEASSSSKNEVKAMADAAVSELGMENLEDGVLHRLCTNEIYTQDQEEECGTGADGHIEVNKTNMDQTKLPQLSFQSSQNLCRILFSRKVLRLKSIPSRLFLDSILHARKTHGRAIVDSVLLPAIHDHDSFSKLTSELVQKVMKEQTTASAVHFLSCTFESTVGRQNISETSECSALDRLPIIFHSEIHLAMVQSILSYSNVPCPVPTRLWTRFNNILNSLWEEVTGFITSVSSTTPSRLSISNSTISCLKDAVGSKNEMAWILHMYCPVNIRDMLVNYSGPGMESDGSNAGSSIEGLRQEGQIRLSNPKLLQLLMTWTLKQGPLCSDLESLQRMRQFCATKLEAKQAKGLVSKLDMFIKKKGGV